MARVTADTTLLREVTTGSLVSAVTNTLMLLATVTVLAVLDPLLLVVTIVVLGGAQVVTGVVVPRIARAAARAQESVGAMAAATMAALSHWPVPSPSATRNESKLSRARAAAATP
jgi:type IV secretory pathway TrbL component